MTRYVPLQRSEHYKAGYSPISNMSYAAEMTTVPLLREELSNVIQHMGIAFQKRSNKDQPSTYELVGLQALKPKENLFVLPDGRWLGAYKPAFYRAYPFTLELNKTNSQLQLCVAENAIKLNIEENDYSFFKNETDLSDHMIKFVSFLEQSLKSRQSTLKLVADLNEANLITPWAITFTEQDDKTATPKVLDGLYHIDIKKLSQLPPELAAKLNQNGALEIAYAQVFSEERVKGLATLQKAHRTLQNRQTQIEKEPDLDEIFGDDDDLFSF